MKINEISVVICNKNSVNYLKKSIPLYKNINLKEIFVIDGNSTDGSLNYLRENNIKFYSDDGNGLSYSRFLGVSKSRGKYIFMAGPDDICDKNFFEELCKEFKKSNYDAATTLFRIKSQTTYWDKSLNLWYAYIRKLGPTKVVGTPTIFKKEVFKHVKYKVNTVGCDDTDISDQLIARNFQIGIINVICNQANFNTLRDIKIKFQLYGKSDLNYYLLKNKNYNFTNWVSKFLHPIKHLFKFSLFLIYNLKVQIIPFVIVITYYRIKGSLKK
jgi:glycosyltransferase involved in cell wall biosynthesis